MKANKKFYIYYTLLVHISAKRQIEVQVYMLQIQYSGLTFETHFVYPFVFPQDSFRDQCALHSGDFLLLTPDSCDVYDGSWNIYIHSSPFVAIFMYGQPFFSFTHL